jgi:zinc transport system permease protein
MFSYQFMQYALLACLLASIGCGVIGTYVVVKRVGFLAGGIAHTILAGMGVAYFYGASPMLGAVIVAIISALLIGLIKLRWRQDEDILIAAFWSVGMAIGILFISRTEGYSVDLMSYLFGNILLVSGRDLLFMLALDITIIVTVSLFYKQFQAMAFDEDFAALRDVHVELIYLIMLCLVALTVVLLINIVGLILIIALLVLPAASAGLFASSVARMMVMSVLLSIGITVGGLILSYRPDLPSGSTIVLLAGFVYVLAILISRRIGKARKASFAGSR